MFYAFIRSLLVIFYRIFYRCKYDFYKYIPSDESFIVCANHTSNLDPPFVGTVIPRRQVFFMAKEELFRNALSAKLFLAVGAFPVKRGAVDKSSLVHAIKLLKNGQILGLFPEGKRVKTGEIGELFHGLAYLALKSNKPILPIAIKWPERIFQPVRVRIGSLIYLPDEKKIVRKVLEEASSKVSEEMNRLLSDL